MMNEYVICPLVDKEINCVDCMEITTICEESIPEVYKEKENWREICENCKYNDF